MIMNHRRSAARKLLALLLALTMVLPSGMVSVFATVPGQSSNQIETVPLDVINTAAEETLPVRSEGVVLASRVFDLPVSVVAPISEGDYSGEWEPEDDFAAFAEPEAVSMARLSANTNLLGAVFSDGTTQGGITIESVEVVYGGRYQMRYRDQIAGHGHTITESGGRFFTTARNASLTDPRIFTVRTPLTSAQISGSMTELEAGLFLSRITYTYGGLPFSAWHGGNNFNVAASAFIHLAGDRLVAHTDGSFDLVSDILFHSPYPAASPSLTGDGYTSPNNRPFDGYRGQGQAGFPLAMRHVIGTFDLEVHLHGAGESPLERAAAVAPAVLDNWDTTNDWMVGTVAVNQAAILNAINAAFAAADPPIIGVTAAWAGAPSTPNTPAAPARTPAQIGSGAYLSGMIRLTHEGRAVNIDVDFRRPAIAESVWHANNPGWVNRNRIPETGPRSPLEHDIYNLVNTYGPRLWGTPNERNAVAYIISQMESAGTNWDVEKVTIPRSTPPVSGRLAFTHGPDIYGVIRPNVTADNISQAADWPRISGARLINLGAYPQLAIPQGISQTEPIIAAITYEARYGAAHSFNLLRLVMAAEALDANIVGIVAAATGNSDIEALAVGNTQHSEIPTPMVNYDGFVGGNVTPAQHPRIPLITTSADLLWEALERAEDFAYKERYTRMNSYSVVATRRATNDPNNPELVMVLSAHLDSVLPAAGASDNASGTAVLIDMARAFAYEDLGNVELRLVAVGAHEGAGGVANAGGGRPVVHQKIQQLRIEGLHDIALNINMDMVVSPAPRPSGAPMDSIAVEIVTPGVGCGNETRARTNLPAILLLEHSQQLWATGIVNARFEQCGGTDHDTFIQQGIDATNLIIMCELNNHLEVAYHNSGDNLEFNYCYDRLRMSRQIVYGAIRRTIDDEITKVAHFDVDEDEGRITLINADQIFNTFTMVEGRFDICGCLGNPSLPICTCDPCLCDVGMGTTVTRPEHIIFRIEYPADYVVLPNFGDINFSNVRVTAVGQTDYVDHAPRDIPRRGTINTPSRVGSEGAEWPRRLGRFESRMRAVGLPDTADSIDAFGLLDLKSEPKGNWEEVACDYCQSAAFRPESNAYELVFVAAQSAVFLTVEETANFAAAGAEGEAQMIASIPIRLNLYDNFMLWYEVDEWARELQVRSGGTEAGGTVGAHNRFVQVRSIGNSHQGRDIWSVTVASNQAAVHHYLNVTRPMMSNNPAELQRQIRAGTYGHRVPLFFHNNHPDEVTGVDSQVSMVEQLIARTYLQWEAVSNEDLTPVWNRTLDTPGGVANNNINFYTRRSGADPQDASLWAETIPNTVTQRLELEEVLDRFIFIFVPTNNPDGRYSMRRGNNYGFDLNRDSSFQTQPESRYIMQEVVKWSPLVFYEFHGHVAALLIEPCTPPHNPNYEYDLMQPCLLRQAYAMGRSAIAGSYHRFMIPLVHRTHGWDDGGVVYTPMFAALFGILGYTLEIPHANQDSHDTNIVKGYAGIKDSLENFELMFINKVEQKRRNVENIDAREQVDPFFINPFLPINDPNRSIGRPREGDRNFFPDYWVIPVDPALQGNLLEAYRTLEKFERHRVRISRSNTDVTHEGTTFPAGTYVISMRQEKRNYVNAMMTAGADFSFFDAMYAEITQNYPDLRGFAASAIWSDTPLFGAVQPVTGISVPATVLDAESSTYLVIRNNNQDAIRLVNELLASNVAVHMLTANYQQGRVGDFVVARSSLTSQRLQGRYVETMALESRPETAEQLVRPRIGAISNHAGVGQGLFSPLTYVLRDLGFDYVWVTSNAGDTPPAGAPADSVSLANLPNDVNILVNHAQNWSNTWSISNERQMPLVFIQPASAAGATAIMNNLFDGRGGAHHVFAQSREGTFDAAFSNTSPLTAHLHDRLDGFYSIGTTVFSSVPEGTVPIIRFDDGQDIFRGGWFPDNEQLAGRYAAFTGFTNAGAPATVFGTTIINRAHTQAYFPMLATAIFMHVSDIDTRGIPVFGLYAFNNGNDNNASLAQAGLIRIWTQLDGVSAPVPYANLEVIAELPDGTCAMKYVRVNNMWENPGYVNIIDANKHAPWAVIYLTVTLDGHVVELTLINNRYLGLRAFNNGTDTEVPSMAGNIRIWPLLGSDGNSAPIPMNAVLSATDQDGNDALGFVVRNRQWTDAGWQDYYINFDVSKDAPWQTIYFTITVYGQTVSVLLINDWFTDEPAPVFGLDMFNNGPGGSPSRPNASLAAVGIIRIWAQLDGVGAHVPFADLTVTAEFPNGANAMQFVRVNNMWENPGNVNLIDVNKSGGAWETIILTVDLNGQEIELILNNALS